MTVDTTQANLDVASTQITTLESEKSILQTTINAAQASLIAASTQIATLESEKASLQTTVETIQTNLDTATTQITTLESEKATLQTTLEATQASLDTANMQIITLEAEKATLQTTLDTTQANLNASIMQLSAYENISPIKGTEYNVVGLGLTGTISVVVTVAEDGTIAKVDVKGTDSDADASFVAKCQDEAFLSQFIGKRIPVEDIDSVVGATVSSVGIIDAVNTVVPIEQVNGTVAKGTARGFAGPVTVEVTFENNMITALAIGDEEFAEVPGFGAKALEPSFIKQFIGKTLPIDVSDIDAISGATITTNAVIEALNAAYESLEK